jgi:hypothetical protein
MANLPYWEQTPTILTPGGGIVTGYADDPIYSRADVAPKTDRNVPSVQLAPSFVAPGGGLVTGYSDDPIYSQAEVAARTNRGGNPIQQQLQANAVAQALSLGRANGRSTGGGVAEALLAMTEPNQPNGSVVLGKSQDRIGAGYWAGEGGAWGSTAPRPSSAVAAIDAVAAPSVALPRPRPNVSPGTVRVADTGNFGVPMSGGMNRNLAGRTAMGAIPGLMQRPQLAARQPIPITVRGGNKTQQALAQVAQATAPRVAPQPTVAATQFQQDRFQTTEGSQLPSSMGSSRWQSGY